MSLDNKSNLNRLSPKLFSSTTLRDAANPEGQQVNIFSLSDSSLLEDTSLGSTSSFKYNTNGSGLISTQQINVDWSQFQDHTFFNSAQVKTNVAFNKILKEFPFDGSNKELEIFMDKLTGFEKYIFDGFPKQRGYLIFSGTSPSETFGGTYVAVKDLAGAQFPNSSTDRSGKQVLDPGYKPLTIEFQFYAPEGPTANDQAILAKQSTPLVGVQDRGFCVSLNTNPSTDTGEASFHVYSGSMIHSVPVQFKKGQWNHLAWTWDRTPGITNQVKGYVNHDLFASSSIMLDIGLLEAPGSDLYVGSGSSINSVFSPLTTLSGAIDELRVWHRVVPDEERRDKEQKNVFAQDSLKLYYRFNEPSGSSSNIVLDHSSNSLHGKLSMGGMVLGVRNISTSSYDAGASPMIYEKLANNPILFPDHPATEDYRLSFAVSATQFDQVNPNLITKLIPKHYLLEGQAFDGTTDESDLYDGGIMLNDYVNGADPRMTQMKATQTLLMLLYTWAKFFDELKLFVQTFSTLGWADYDLEDTTPDEFLQYAAKQYGIELPPLFRGATINQFINAENLGVDYGFSEVSLQQVQNQIWRRILVNMNDILKSKGTIHSIKSFIRATGIEPDSVFRIREYGGPTTKQLSFARNTRTETAQFLNFNNNGLLISPYLTALRTEPGYPETGTTPTEWISLTSGSWTYEGLYRFDRTDIENNNIVTQSLVRMETTAIGGSEPNVLFGNLQYVSGSGINLYFKSSNDPTVTPLVLALTGADLFDGDPWNVSFGFQRSDMIGSEVSSSYFIRAAKQVNGEIFETYKTSSFYVPAPDEPGYENVGLNAKLDSNPGSRNTSGPFFIIGSQSLGDGASSLNDQSAFTPTEFNTYTFSEFTGKVSQVRFWSKYVTDVEYEEHVRYYRSVGVQNPDVNFNFNTTSSGSYERLRISAEMEQVITSSDVSGDILIEDFSQGGFIGWPTNPTGITGSFEYQGLQAQNFPPNSSAVFSPETISFSYISPEFDEGSTTEKVRVRSFLEEENVASTPWAEGAPVYQMNPAEEPTDSTKLSIDFSIADALNQDIVTIFSTLDALDNILGSPELAFSTEYVGLEHLREVYFNKLTDKINIKGFMEFFKWFDTNISTFVSQLVPRKTRFQGTNFVIENSMLERSKVAYSWEEQYMGDLITWRRKEILLQLFVGAMVRY